MTLENRLKAAGLGGVLLLSAALIGKYEGEVRGVYIDPVGIPTACFGQTGAWVRPGMRFTAEECTGMLAAEVRKVHESIQRCLPGASAGVQVAFTSFGYNVGVRAACNSTAARLIRAGKVKQGCAELKRWVYAGGKVLPGLVRRREEEASVCSS